MDSTEYLSTVREQLRAYDFLEQGDGSPSDYPLYYRGTDGRVRTREEWVILVELDEASVETVKETIDTAVNAFSELADENGPLDRRWWYLLMVPPTVNRPMVVAVERAAGSIEQNDRDGMFLPVLADLENGRLERTEASGTQNITAFRKVVKNVDDYFRL
jgi:hypothetical protein